MSHVHRFRQRSWRRACIAAALGVASLAALIVWPADDAGHRDGSAIATAGTSPDAAHQPPLNEMLAGASTSPSTSPPVSTTPSGTATTTPAATTSVPVTVSEPAQHDAVTATTATPAAPAQVEVPRTSTVAYAAAGVGVYASVEDRSPTWSFPATTAFTSPTTLLVTRDLGGWLEVVVPIRTNNVRGYVSSGAVQLRSTSRALVVDTANNTLSFYDNATLTDSFPAATGAADSPTPKGLFSVTDLIGTGNPDGAYGPYVIATSGRSDVYDFFNGGEPLLGIHGTNHPELLGTSVSHGCVRLNNAVIASLVTQVPLGTPVLVI